LFSKSNPCWLDLKDQDLDQTGRVLASIKFGLSERQSLVPDDATTVQTKFVSNPGGVDMQSPREQSEFLLENVLVDARNFEEKFSSSFVEAGKKN
jgi:hypothetical protein